LVSWNFFFNFSKKNVNQHFQALISAKFTLFQNRRQKGFNRGALRFCGEGFRFVRGGLTFQKLTKTQLIYSASCFNLGGLGAFFWGAKPPKAPRNDGTALFCDFLAFPFLTKILQRANKVTGENFANPYR